MQNPKYEVAVIENGKIIKIYPQAEYNKYIIDGYNKNPAMGANAGIGNVAPIEQANQATIDTLNAMTQSFENTAKQAKIQNEQAIAQVNQTMHGGISNITSMFYNVAILFIVLTLVIVFTKVLMGGKKKNSK